MKRILGILITILLFQTACRDDDGTQPPEFPPLNRGTIEANRIQVTFSPRNDPNNQTTFEYYDMDGPGGNDPIMNETIMLNRPIVGEFFTYSCSVRIFQDNVDVTDNLRNLETSYAICYRDVDSRNLRLTDRDLDSEGKPIGLLAEFVTRDEGASSNPSNGSGTLRITLNFQQEKDGTCDAGIRILEAPMNYQLN